MGIITTQTTQYQCDDCKKCAMQNENGGLLPAGWRYSDNAYGSPGETNHHITITCYDCQNKDKDNLC